MTFKIGVAKVDITPNIGSPTRRWHLPDSRARITDIRWPMYARTVALSDGDSVSTVTSMEVCCLYKCHHDQIRERVRELSSVPIEHIILHNAHQHSDSFIEYEPAYDIFGLNEIAFDLDFIRGLASKVATSICLAVQRLTPARVGYASGAVEEGIASCRRIPTPGGKLAWRASRPAPEVRALPRGHIDPEVGVLVFSSPAGETLATLYNYACHPTVAGGDSPSVASADYPGFASHTIESWCGGLALFLHGCSGDINPGKYVRGDAVHFDDRIADARRMGRLLAGEVVKTAERIEADDVRSCRVVAKDCLLPVQPGADNVEQALAHARMTLEDWKRKGTDPRTALRKYIIARKIVAGGCPVTMFGMKINEFYAAFLPGEPFTELGERIKVAAGAGRTLVASTCGEDPFYMPTREAFVQGGYETSYIATPETGETLVAEAMGLTLQVKSSCQPAAVSASQSGVWV